MPSLRRSVSSLAALTTFEAASRLGGFTAAARELGVTQAAVSRQIRLLEADLHARLFVRAHRRVELTPAGKVLAMAVGQAFDRIGDAIEVIRPEAVAAQPGLLRVGASLGFTQFWLLPRLATFRAAHPDVSVRLVSQDLPIYLGEDGVDVAIRYGRPPYRDGHVTVSMPDEIAPVCSPRLSSRVAGEPFPGNLFILPRIDAEAHDAGWVTWRRWFSLVGLGRIDDSGILQFNHYTDAIHAAIDGQGVALGWTNLLELPLRDGRLVRLGDRSVFPDETYNLVVPRTAVHAACVAAFASWIASEFAAAASTIAK